MGNQNTSGIVEEEKGTNKASDSVVAVSPPDDVTEQDQILIQEEEANADAQDAEVDKISSVERLESDNKDIEDHKGSVEGSDAVIDISTNDSNLGEGASKLSDEELDQPCTLKDTSHEAVDSTSDIQEDQNMLVKETLEVDDHDMVSVEGMLSEACAHKEELERDGDPPLEEQSNSSNSVNGAATISLPDSSTAANESENECLALDNEEKPMVHELGNADANNTSCVDQHQPSDQEINKFLIKSTSDPTDMIKSDILDDAEKHEDNEPTDQNMLEKALHRESEPSATENESETTEKCVVELQSSTEIDTLHLSSKTEEAETQYCDDSESKVGAGVKMLDTESNPSFTEAAVELRKSPSFDFGLAFDTRSEESDQTPLLYQDKTARRSLSSCSNIRFQNRSVQTEFLKKPLQFESVQVEEKTIRMERSNSENANAITKETHKNGSTALPSRDDEATISPKVNSKRKPRSSLFTTCICCTAAIS
ncbi:hypothetical protein C2S51_013839 [Perilla frutescens var. frutescens]|nr:hypothetical protein C2S51_013839 [Perilla frutescens var. frutescens]